MKFTLKDLKIPMGEIWSEMFLESGEHPYSDFSSSKIAVNL